MAFKENTVDPMVMTYCASKAAQEHGDARKAIDMLRIAAELAEREEREIVTMEHVNKAQSVMERDQVNSIVITLPIQHKATLASIILNQGNKNNSQQTTGEVYSTYTKLCNSYNLDEHNNMNVLCMGGRVIKISEAKNIVKSFLDASFIDEEKYVRRLNKINKLD